VSVWLYASVIAGLFCLSVLAVLIYLLDRSASNAERPDQDHFR
jgi:hypothetical protein